MANLMMTIQQYLLSCYKDRNVKGMTVMPLEQCLCLQ